MSTLPKTYAFIEKLAKLPFIDEIYLYGSRARGTHRDRSDIDIAIVSPNASLNDWLLVESIIEDADTLLKIDCVRFDTLKNEELKQNIIQDKVVLFTRNTLNEPTKKSKIKALANALNRLQEALAEASESNGLSMDGTIQRFEFSFELTWKVFQEKLAFLGIETNSPRTAIQAAFAQKWFDDETIWLSMLSSRNKSSHIYDEETATEIFRQIQVYYPQMRLAYERLKSIH